MKDRDVKKDWLVVSIEVALDWLIHSAAIGSTNPKPSRIGLVERFLCDWLDQSKDHSHEFYVISKYSEKTDPI